MGFDFYMGNADLAKRLYGFKFFNASDTMVQDLFARSVATRMINLNPGVTKVSYTIRTIRYPSMDEFLKNKPVHQAQLYTTEFVLRQH